MTRVTADAAMPEQLSPVRLLVTLRVLIFSIEGAMMCALVDLLPEDAPVGAETCRGIKGHFMRV